MGVPANAEIVARFEASILEAEKAVVIAARNVATYAEQRGDVDVLRIYANLQFFINPQTLSRNGLKDRERDQ